MDEHLEISVVLTTYNRCALLPRALESVLTQDAGQVRYEVVVVDNNSQDETRAVVESYIERGHSNLRYLFESRQGVSYARNTGVENTRGPIVAFLDDDESAAPNWVAVIKKTFDEHPEVDCLGGKVLPRWEKEPPEWLATNYDWSPVALTDYGDIPFYSNAERPICFIGGNLAVRRTVFDKIGLFDTALQRVKDNIGSMEDHEFLMRMWRIGDQGLYVPEMIVEAEVPIKRMNKAYYRRWHTGHGKYCALNHFVEQFDSDGRFLINPLQSTKLFGTPTFVYRQLLEKSVEWLQSVWQRNEISAFLRENEIRYLVSYIRTSNQYNRDNKPLHSELNSLLKKCIKVANRHHTRKV